MNSKGVKVSKHEMRSQIDQHLNMESKIYGSTAFLQDNDIDPSLSQSFSEGSNSYEKIVSFPKLCKLFEYYFFRQW